MKFEKIPENNKNDNESEKQAENKVYTNNTEMVKDNLKKLSGYHLEETETEKRIEESILNVADNKTNSGMQLPQLEKKNFSPAKQKRKDQDHVIEVQ